MKKDRILPALFAAAVLTAALLAAGCTGSPLDTSNRPALSSESTATSAVTVPAATTQPKGILYKNGSYEGIGYGKNGAIQVRIELLADRIVSLELVSHRDTADYIQPEWDAIYAQVMDQDSPDLSKVDAVSGATASAKGIHDAIQNALYKAKK